MATATFRRGQETRANIGGWWFAVAFRPLFAAASLFAAAAIPLWIWIYLTGIATIAGMPAAIWHAHEMVFGFVPPIMAGYLLAATPNWSGKLPTQGLPLAGLVLLWALGRLVPLASPLVPAIVAESLFPLAVAAVLWREARHRRPGQSRHGLALFPVIAAAAAAHRVFAFDPEVAALFARGGVAVAMLLISAVGGRLVPSLTRNSLAGRCADRVPVPYGRFDVIVLLIASLALAVWVASPLSPASAATMTIAGLLQALRLARWRGWLLRRADILALHAGYAWLVAGTLLAGAAAEPLSLSLAPPDAALHAMTAGAIGCMTLAVMSRLAVHRGPGGKASGRLAAIALVAVNLGATLRVAAPLLPEHMPVLLIAGATVWSVAFLLFALALARGRRQ
jgi:uncharacterized protein involved in response to NO